MLNRSPERIKVERRIGADLNRLYGPLPEALRYMEEILAKHPEAILSEHWTGYEDMEMTFVWLELETEDEWNKRQWEIKEEMRMEAEKNRELKERAKRKLQWERLNKEFGR